MVWQPALPINYQGLIGGFLVTDGAGPGGLLLIHLKVEGRVEALQVGAGESPAGHDQPHLAQLAEKREKELKGTPRLFST